MFIPPSSAQGKQNTTTPAYGFWYLCSEVAAVGMMEQTFVHYVSHAFIQKAPACYLCVHVLLAKISNSLASFPPT